MTVTTDGKVFVKGYIRADGARVESYYRDPPPSGSGSIADITNQKQIDAAKKAAEKAKKAAEKAKAIADALKKFALDNLDTMLLSRNIDDAIRSGRKVDQAMIDQLSRAYEDAFKSAEDAMKIIPDAERIKMQKQINDLIDAAVYDAEVGASKYGTPGYTRPSYLITKTAVTKAKALAGAKFIRVWNSRGGQLTKAIMATKDANGTLDLKKLGDELNRLMQKPGMGDIAKNLTASERYALNSRGITVSGRKFKAPDFRLNGDQSLKPMLKTINTMEKAGNPILKQKAADLAKVGVTQSAKSGAWTVTKTGLKAAGKMLPVAAGVLEATDRLDNGKDVGEATRGAIITTIASIAGSAAGGAVAGSVVPGAGTLGGFIFGLVGGIGGAIAGGWGSDRLDDTFKKK
jgi:hypothetical protein